MSHTTTISALGIRDVNAMRQAVSDLQAEGVNCELVENTKPRAYYSNQVEECDYVLQLNDGKYDVGFKMGEDGTYNAVLDTYQGHVGKQVGATCPMPSTQDGKAQHAIGRFRQHYTKNATINAATQAGHNYIGTDVTSDGEFEVVLELNA